MFLRFLGVIAQEIDGLAQFGNGVELGLARFPCQQRKNFAVMLLIEIGCLAQHRCPLRDRYIPGPGLADGVERLLLVGLDNLADLQVLEGGIENLVRTAAGHRAHGDRRRAPEFFGKGRAFRHIVVHVGAIGEIPAARVEPLRHIEIGRLDDPRTACLLIGLQRLERIGGDHFGSDRMIGQLVDEGGIGAIFEQAADQIGEQFAMLADRRVDA